MKIYLIVNLVLALFTIVIRTIKISIIKYPVGNELQINLLSILVSIGWAIWTILLIR